MDSIDKVSYTLDVRGMPCPYPNIKTQLKLEEMKPNEILKVISNEKHSSSSIPKYCTKFGHNLMLSEEKEGLYIFYIQRGKIEKEF